MPTSPKPLSAVDSAWARMDEDGNAADVVVMMRFTGRVDRERLAELVASHLLTKPRFSERVVEPRRGAWRPRWVRASGGVEDHLSTRVIPEPGGELGLRALVSKLISTPFHPAHSPWRLCLIEGLAEGSALIAHVHHCLGDGFALVQVLLTMTEEVVGDDLEADAQGLPSQGLPSQASPGTRASPGARASHPPLRAPLQRVSRALRSLGDLGHVLGVPFDRGTHLRGRLSGERRVAWSRSISLQAVRAAARARGSTVNDVLLAALSSALREHLKTQGGVEPVRAVVPVNLRGVLSPPSADEGNYFGLVFLDLPVEEPSIDERFRSIKHQMDRLKASQEAFITLQLLRLVGRAPLRLARLALWVFAQKASFVVSNVPGPQRPLSLAGRRIRDLMFWVPHPQGLACGASILSYAGAIRVGIRTDAAVIAEPKILANAFADALETWLRLTETPSDDLAPADKSDSVAPPPGITRA